jgi:hypothetical protein
MAATTRITSFSGTDNPSDNSGKMVIATFAVEAGIARSRGDGVIAGR